MHRFTRTALLAAGSLLVLGTRTAAGQEVPVPPADTTATAPAAPPKPAGPIVRRWGFDVITGAIDGVAAENAGTGNRLWGAQFSLGITAYRVFTVNGDFGIVGMSDEAPFSQETNQGERSSGVAAGMASLAVGLRTPPVGARNMAVSAGVNAGASWLDVNRTITQCIDCHGEDVQIRAGEFVEPGVHLSWGRGGISARYRMYGSGSDVQDAMMIGLTGTF